MRLFILVAMLCMAISPAFAAEPAWPIYWVKQTPSSPKVLNTLPDEDVFTGSTPDSVAKFFVSASDNNLPAHQLTENEFFERIKSIADSKRPALVYFHGCCADEASTLSSAKKLSKAADVPVIMYRWPAFTKFGSAVDNYRDNENTCERSMGRALRFFDKLESVLPPSQTILLGHSMGSRFIVEFLDRRSSKLLLDFDRSTYKMCILAAADAQAERFCQQIKKIARGSKVTYVLLHKNDLALSISGLLHQAFPRLGKYGNIKYKDSPDHHLQVLDVSVLTPDIANHAMPLDLIATMIKKSYAPLGIVASRYYLIPTTPNTWTISLTPPKKPNFDPSRKLTRTKFSTKTTLTPQEMELLKNIVRNSKQQQPQPSK